MDRFAQYMVNSFGNYRGYICKYFSCELLAVANLIIQMILLNTLFHGRWYWYGWDIVQLYWGNISGNPSFLEDDTNPMVMVSSARFFAEFAANSNIVYTLLFFPAFQVFPKQTKCAYHRFGPTGSVEDLDFLCLLTLNHFNDKFSLLFWYWSLLLLSLFIFNFIGRFMQAGFSLLRVRAITAMVNYELDTKRIFKGDLQKLIYEIEISDWFMLYHVSFWFGF